MHAFIRFVLYTIIIIKPPSTSCLHIPNDLQSNTHKIHPFFPNAEQLKEDLNRELRNASIFNANYARPPPELLDPNYGITDYNRKETLNNTEKDIALLAALDRMRSIDLDAEKYANIFSKAFIAGYSAALLEKPPRPPNNQSNGNMNKVPSLTSKARVRKVSKAANMKKSSLAEEFANGYASAKNKAMSHAKHKMTKSSDTLPFNITSDAVGYGAAYASGYSLAAADKAARTGKFKHINVKPWKMNNAAAAGYAAYYAAAIAQTRAVRHPDSSLSIGLLNNHDKSIVEDHETSEKNNNGIENNEASVIEQKDLAQNNAEGFKRNTDGDEDGNQDDKISSSRTNLNPEPSVKDPDFCMAEKHERNVHIYKPSELEDNDRNINNLSVNIRQTPLSSRSLYQNDAILNQNKRTDEDVIATNVIIEDKNKLSDDNNRCVSLDIESANQNRYIDGKSTSFAGGNNRLEDIDGSRKLVSARDSQRCHEGIGSDPGDQSDSAIERVLDVSEKREKMKGKRLRKCGKRKRRKKRKKVKSIINCSI